MKRKQKKISISIIRRYLIITVSCIIYGAGISLLIDPNNLAPGGFTGLSVMTSRIVPVETGTLYLLFNIPVLFLAIWKFGWKFTTSTLYSIFIVSETTNFFSEYPPITTEPILGAIFGGIFIAVGMGFVFRSHATTGGIDIIVKCLRKKVPHLKTGTLMLLIDAVIVSISGMVFGNLNSVLYSIVALFATSYVLDIILYGHEEARLIYIISDNSDIMTRRILEEMETGVTLLEGYGAYEKKEKRIVMCVVKKQMAHRVEEIVKQEDATAFMIITSASQIYGEGYKSYFGEII